MKLLNHGIHITGNGPIIMVDDNDDDRFVAGMMLQRSRVTNPFVELPSGPAFIEYLDGVLGGVDHFPELVLMDLNMPGMNGLEATAHVRKQPRFKDLPIIAMLTTSQDPRDKERAQKMGVDGFFGKPMDPRVYVEFFDSLIAPTKSKLSA